jgi:hypothetical protein
MATDFPQPEPIDFTEGQQELVTTAVVDPHVAEPVSPITEVPAPAVPKPPRRPMLDIYTVMLIISLVSISLACLFLLMEFSGYDYVYRPRP